MAPAKASKKKVGKRALDDETIVNPEREITLSNGETYVVRPWGMTKGALVLERMDRLTPKLLPKPGEDGSPATWNARDVLGRAFDEIVDLVALTLDVEVEEMKREPHEGGWTFEDILEATDAVIEVCIARSDGRGALPLLIKVVGRMTTALVSQGGVTRSNVSEKAAT